MTKIEKELRKRLQTVKQERQIVLESLGREFSRYRMAVEKTLEKEAQWLEEIIAEMENENERD